MNGTTDDLDQRKLEVEVGLASQKAADKFDQETKLPKMRLVAISNAKPISYLGAGAFNQVYKVKVDNKLLARKSLKASVRNDRAKFRGGAVDLVHEAKLLNTLTHPNILQMQGVSTDSWKYCYLDGESFCLYLDRLTGSVLDKFEEWQYTKKSSCSHRLRRLETIASPIARAIAYLHERQIIFRDIKPANMGFDAKGIVKLYDFGMAREVDPDRKLTGVSGTKLYMAPEVALSQNYGLPADVYSFAMFLFECCSLEKPCLELVLDKEDYFGLVVEGHYRPKLSEHIFSDQLETLLSKAWAKDPAARPPMEELVTQLEECVDELDATVQATSWFPWLTPTTNIGLALSRSRSGEKKLRIARTRSTDQASRTKKPAEKLMPKPRRSVSNTWY